MKNIFPVARSQHDAVVESYATLCDTYREQAAALESYVLQRDHLAKTLAAIAGERDTAQSLAVLALTMLNEVNATRTGGQSFRERREALNATASEQGLWPRTQDKEGEV